MSVEATSGLEAGFATGLDTRAEPGIGPGRRTLDILVGGALVLLTAPLVLAAALVILVTDGRPVLFHQERVGQRARPFRLTKLRTMRAAGPRSGPGSGPGVTASGDPRITRVGRVLRRTSIDELPQLWAVVRGRMTLVGPRPESVDLAARYPAACRPVLWARPGLTGPAQLRFRERAARPPEGWDVEDWYLRVLVPVRAAEDLAYLRRAGVWSTLCYLALTAGFVVGLVDLERPVAAPGPSAAE